MRERKFDSLFFISESSFRRTLKRKKFSVSRIGSADNAAAATVLDQYGVKNDLNCVSPLNLESRGYEAS
jgi:hypothetical protein